MTDTLYDLVDNANLMEIDDKSIRYFGLDIDGLEEEEGDDAMCLHVEMTDENFDRWEWFFTIKELKEATFNPRTKSWSLQYGNEGWPLEIKLFTLTQILPRGY